MVFFGTAGGGRTAARNLVSLIQFRSEVWRGLGFCNHGLVVMEGRLQENLSPPAVMCTAPPSVRRKEGKNGGIECEKTLSKKEQIDGSGDEEDEEKAGWAAICLATDAPRRAFNLQQEPYLDLLVFFIRLHKKMLPPPLFFSFPETGTYERMGSGAMAQLTRHDTAMRVTATNVRTRNGNKTCRGAQSALSASLRARWRMISVE